MLNVLIAWTLVQTNCKILMTRVQKGRYKALRPDQRMAMLCPKTAWFLKAMMRHQRQGLPANGLLLPSDQPLLRYH